MHGGERRHHLLARADRAHARGGRAPCSSATLSASASVAIGSSGRIQPVRRGRVPGLHLPLAALARDRARRARRLEQRRRNDLVRIREAGALAGHRAHADALLDAVAAFLDDAVLERPVLLARELEIEVARRRRSRRAASRAPVRGAGRRGPRARGSARARTAGRRVMPSPGASARENSRASPSGRPGRALP